MITPTVKKCHCFLTNSERSPYRKLELLCGKEHGGWPFCFSGHRVKDTQTHYMCLLPGLAIFRGLYTGSMES